MTGGEVAQTIASLALLITALSGAVVSLVTVFRISKEMTRVSHEVTSVHTEVKTSNGITMAALADRAEGRRIEADVPQADRTASETQYVNRLNEGDAHE